MARETEDERISRKFWSEIAQGNDPPGSDGGRWNEPRNIEVLTGEDVYRISSDREKVRSKGDDEK